jgi:hypothetical protein
MSGCRGVYKARLNARLKVWATRIAVYTVEGSRRLPATLRNPCGLQSSGSPAAVIASRSHRLKPSTVNGLSYSVLMIPMPEKSARTNPLSRPLVALNLTEC